MTWFLRLAALACLVACCVSGAPLVISLLAAGALAFAVLAEMHCASWCWCGHGKPAHERYSHGTHCAVGECTCEKFSAPIIWRSQA